MDYLLAVAAISLVSLTLSIISISRKNTNFSKEPNKLINQNLDAALEISSIEGEFESQDKLPLGILTIPVPDTADNDLVLLFGSESDLQNYRPNIQEIVQHIPKELTQLAVGADTLLQTGLNLAQSQGMLVRLTKESTQAYKSSHHIKDGVGAVMGIFRDGQGKFSHVLRFKPATSLAAITSITGLLNTIAMQAQLASIERAIAEVAATTKRIEKVQWNLIDSEMRAVSQILKETYDAAYASQRLTDSMWDEIQGIALLVKKFEIFTASQLRDLIFEVRELKTVKQKKNWFSQNKVRLRENLLVAELCTQISAQYGALRLWRLAVTKDSSHEYYANMLNNAIMSRNQDIESLHIEMRSAIESSASDIKLRVPILKVGFLDSKSLKRLIEAVQSDFEVITGDRWRHPGTIYDELSE